MSTYVSTSTPAASSADFSPTAKTAESIESTPSKGEQRLDKHEKPSLHHASLKGDIETVYNILYSDRNCTIQVNENGETALLLAVTEGHTEIVRLLLQMGADVHHVNKDGWDALLLASYKGYTAIVRILLKYSANVHRVDNSGWTALHRASSRGRTDIVCILLKNGANVCRANGDGETPLQLASKYKKAETARTLLEHGAAGITIESLRALIQM